MKCHEDSANKEIPHFNLYPGRPVDPVQPEPTSVIIIGAVISGAGAVEYLTQNEINDFLVLEAQHVIGGRMKLRAHERAECETRSKLGGRRKWPARDPNLDHGPKAQLYDPCNELRRRAPTPRRRDSGQIKCKSPFQVQT